MSNSNANQMFFFVFRWMDKWFQFINSVFVVIWQPQISLHLVQSSENIFTRKITTKFIKKLWVFQKFKVKNYLTIKSSSTTLASDDFIACNTSSRLFVCFFLFFRCDVTRVNESSFTFGSFVMLNNWKYNKIRNKFGVKIIFFSYKITISLNIYRRLK